MNGTRRTTLQPFRDEAVAQGVPADEVERWLDLARPCAILAQDWDGPVVGRFGGPLRLPAAAADPYFPFVASIDLASLPEGAADLALPPDGELLLFAFAGDDYNGSTLGEAVYIPVGTRVEERAKNDAWRGYADDPEVVEQYPDGPLHATVQVHLPFVYERSGGPLPGHPHSVELGELWGQIGPDEPTGTCLQLGGYATEEVMDDEDPVADAASAACRAAEHGKWGVGWALSSAAEDWLLLADWWPTPDVQHTEGMTVHWVIQREDLAAHRFERTFVTVFWNP